MQLPEPLSSPLPYSVKDALIKAELELDSAGAAEDAVVGEATAEVLA